LSVLLAKLFDVVLALVHHQVLLLLKLVGQVLSYHPVVILSASEALVELCLVLFKLLDTLKVLLARAKAVVADADRCVVATTDCFDVFLGVVHDDAH